MRIGTFTLCLVAALGLSAGAASAYDSMGGFDQPYTGESNMFGKGAWGNGRGTAIPLPDQGPSYGFYYGQPYSGGSNLFGTGFWASEYTVRSGGGQGRATSSMGDATFSDGPLGDKVAGGYGDEGYGKGDHGKPGKDGHDGYDTPGKDGKDGKPGYEHGGKGKPPTHDKPKHEKPTAEVEYRYIPYPRTQTVIIPRRSTTVVVMQQVQKTELGHLNVSYEARSETFGAICLDGKGNEHAALTVKPGGADSNYAGEIFRCEGDQMLRVSYATGAVVIRGSVQTSDGTSYKDCDGGDALVRSRGGELVCSPKRPMSRGMERALASGDDSTEVDFASAPAGGGIDISDMELTGGVGGAGGM